MRLDGYRSRGWLRIPFDRELLAWVSEVLPVAKDTVIAPENARWHVCEHTWFVGVNALPNDRTGALAGRLPLSGQAVETVAALGFPTDRWDRAQVSTVFPGYPRPRDGETEAAFAYRRDRDAAHVDGLTAIGLTRRRMLREPHAFILGIPLTEVEPEASPLVVWEGSHGIMRNAFDAVLRQHPPETWRDVDLTEAYHAARHDVFRRCTRVTAHARPGEAYLVHRLALHGVAPWKPGAKAPDEGRMIAYFRPLLEGKVSEWIDAD